MRLQGCIHLSTRTVEITYSLWLLLTTSAIGRQDNSYKVVGSRVFTAERRLLNVVSSQSIAAGGAPLADEIDALNRTPSIKARSGLKNKKKDRERHAQPSGFICTYQRRGVLAGSPLASAANSLVFCSEDSPAGFDTAQYTTATDNDAAEPIYNRPRPG